MELLIYLLVAVGFAVLGMALLVPDVGEVAFLKRCLYETPGNMTLKLYQNDVTPAEGDTDATYTVATFTGYSNKTLTATQSASTWAAPTTSSGTTSAEYGGGTPQTWTNTGSSQTIYGYYVQDGSNVLMYAERFGTSRTLDTNDTLNLTPRLELA